MLALGIGLLPFVLLEAGLWLFGAGSQADDVHAGFGNATALFEKNEAEGVYQTNLAKHQFFVSQQFPIEKPKSEFRIFCLGGSTVQGRPYRPETSFGKWLEIELNAIDATHDYRTVNCGGISYASYRLRPVLREVLQYEPDLIVLATGHNEFLEDRTYSSVRARSPVRRMVEKAAMSLRTVRVLRTAIGGAPRVEPTEDQPAASDSVEARLDDEAGYASYHRDNAWHRQVVQQYQDSVQEMMTMCADAEVPLLTVRLGSNLRDCPPFKSEHRADLSVEDQQQWQLLFDDAGRVDRKEPAVALAMYEEALSIDDQYALLHFRVARCKDQLGKFDDAVVSYQLSRDADICPLRMTSDMSEKFANIATDNKVPLVDAEALIAAESTHGIPGFDSYIDHVHPTIGAHQRIAAAMVQTLLEDGLVKAGELLAAHERRALFRQHLEDLGPAYFSNGRRRIGWLEGWARRNRLWEEIQPYDSRSFVASMIRAIDLHDYEAAEQHLTAALSENANVTEILLQRAAELFRQGRASDADWVLQQVGRRKLSDSQVVGVDFARMVIAIELDDKDMVKELFDQNAEAWGNSTASIPEAWLQQMPDAIAQAKTHGE